jgi:hypothetical protein
MAAMMGDAFGVSRALKTSPPSLVEGVRKFSS